MVETNRFIFDRSGLDDVVCITKDGKKVTRLEEHTARPLGWMRGDIFMINFNKTCPTCGHDTLLIQKCIYVTMNGFTGNLEILELATPEERAQLEQIATRMRKNAIDYPQMKSLIAGL